MRFEWDQRKAETNLKKHGIHLADAEDVFKDVLAVTVLDDRAGEERHITVGKDAMGRLLVVVYVWRGARIRLISARLAEPRERRQYEERR